MVDPMSGKIFCIALCVAGSTLLSSAWADNDPTKPPPGFGNLPGADQPLVLEAPLVVQSLFLTGKHPYAVVDDMTVRVGDRLADSRVSKIDEHGVWLGTRKDRRLLKLTPDISKTASGKSNKRMEMKK